MPRCSSAGTPRQDCSGCSGVSPTPWDGDQRPHVPRSVLCSRVGECPHRPGTRLSTSILLQVKNVADGASMQDETATLAYSEKPTSPIAAPPYSPPSYSYPPQNGYYPSGTYSSRG